MLHFNSIKAFSLKIGDVVPTPLPWGGWNKNSPVLITAVSKSDGMLVFKLESGKTFKAFPMNTIPVQTKTA